MSQPAPWKTLTMTGSAKMAPSSLPAADESLAMGKRGSDCSSSHTSAHAQHQRPQPTGQDMCLPRGTAKNLRTCHVISLSLIFPNLHQSITPPNELGDVSSSRCRQESEDMPCHFAIADPPIKFTLDQGLCARRRSAAEGHELTNVGPEGKSVDHEVLLPRRDLQQAREPLRRPWAQSADGAAGSWPKTALSATAGAPVAPCLRNLSGLSDRQWLALPRGRGNFGFVFLVSVAM